MYALSVRSGGIALVRVREMFKVCVSPPSVLELVVAVMHRHASSKHMLV